MATASPPRASSTPSAAAAAASAQADEPPVYTYHCICAQLLFATTTPLPALPRRGAASSSNPDAASPLDRAHILPLPKQPPGADDADRHYALTLHVQPDRKPTIVQREDGLEKRWLQRCARCRCVVGYALDWGHWGAEGEGRSGPRGDVVYLVEGSCVGTGEMGSAERGEGVTAGGEVRRQSGRRKDDNFLMG